MIAIVGWSAACGGSETTETLPQVVVESVSVTPATTMVAVSELVTFTAEATFSDGTTLDVTARAQWASLDESKLIRRANSEFRGVAEGAAGVSATFTDDNDNSVTGRADVTITGAPLTDLQVTPTAPSIEISETVALTAIGTFASGASREVSTEIDWTSADTSIATVVGGRVTGLSPGSVMITASRGDVNASSTVTVREPRIVDLRIAGSSAAIPSGQTRQYVAEATLSSGSTVAITAEVEWTSMNPAVAAVGSDVDPGLVTAVSEGATSITIRHLPTGLVANRNIRVSPPTLVRFEVSPSTQETFAGDTIFFAAVAVFSDGTTENITRDVQWRSSDPNIATVNNQQTLRGQVIANVPGVVTISVRDDMLDIDSDETNTSAVLTVQEAQLRSILVEPRMATTPAGRTFQFSARGTFSNGSTQDLTNAVEWRATPITNATIDENGLATGVAAGPATISARDPSTGVTSDNLSATLTVAPPVIEALTITPANPVLVIDDIRTIDAIGDFSDGSTESVRSRVTWQSSDTTVVQASSGGSLRAIGIGTATVSATDFSTMVSASTVIRVVPLELVGVQITPARLTLPPGAEAAVQVEARFNNGTVEDVTDTITYTNTDATVAQRGTTGNRTNRVFAVTPGSATITATDPVTGRFDRLAITVSSTISLNGIEISAPSPTVARGFTEQFRALGNYSNNATYDLTHAVTWGSSVPARATVSNDLDEAGEVTGVTTGTTAIIATRGILRAERTITVRPPIQTRSWNPAGVTTVDGTSSTFRNVGSITFTANDFGTNATIDDVDITVDFIKIFGNNCSSPLNGCPRHQDLAFRLVGPGGTPTVALTGPANNINSTWNGCTQMSGDAVITFDDEAAGFPARSTPTTGTIRSESALSGFDGRNPVGTWVLQVQSLFSFRATCVDAYSITIRAR